MRFELVGVDAVVGGIVLVKAEEGGVRAELVGQWLVCDDQCKQTAQPQVVVCLDEVGVGDGLEPYDFDNFAYIVGSEQFVDVAHKLFLVCLGVFAVVGVGLAHADVVHQLYEGVVFVECLQRVF